MPGLSCSLPLTCLQDSPVHVESGFIATLLAPPAAHSMSGLTVLPHRRRHIGSGGHNARPHSCRYTAPRHAATHVAAYWGGLGSHRTTQDRQQPTGKTRANYQRNRAAKAGVQLRSKGLARVRWLESSLL
jgi:hypothetical protein